MTDYKRIADELDRAVSEIMASVYEKRPDDTGTWECDPTVIRNGVMKVARVAQWARGLHETHQEREVVEKMRAAKEPQP